MDTPLFKSAEENFGTIYSYYDFIRKKAEKYNSFITKFSNSTKEYCKNMKDCFDSEITENNVDLKKENNQGSKRKSTNGIIKVNVDLNDTWMIQKTIDISLIENNIEKINKVFENYFESLELFAGTIEAQSTSLKQSIEKAKDSINDIKDNYLRSKNSFIQNYNEFEQLNKKMSTMYFEQEKNIIDFLIKNKLPVTKDKEVELNLKIFDALDNQKALKDQFIKLGNFGKKFNDSYEEYFKQIKDSTITFYRKFKEVIENIDKFYLKSFDTKIKEYNSKINNIENNNKDFNDNLNQGLKNIDPKLSEISFDIYRINTIKCNTKEENHLDDNGKFLINMIRNSTLKKIDETDIFYVARKMNNFEYIDKKEYVINVEREKIKLRDKLYKLFYFSNINKVKKNNDKNNENKTNTNIDIKDMVQEENKIDNYEEEITEEDLNYILKLMKRKEYRDYLLTKLNNHRAEGSLVMPEKIYKYFVTIFLEIMKYLVEEKKNDAVNELNIDYVATRYIFILSQTFYYKKDGEKIYLQNGIKNQKIFQSTQFWIKLLQYNIKLELEKLVNKSHRKYSDKEYKEKEKEICIMQVLPYLSGFDGFGVKKETVEVIANFFIKEYQLNEESQKLIFEAIKISENQ